MTVARYDAVADFYSDNFSAVDQVLATLLEVLGPVDGLDVLDLACGHGRATREPARRGAAATGVDVSAKLLAQAAPGIRYLHGDAASREWHRGLAGTVATRPRGAKRAKGQPATTTASNGATDHALR